MIEFIFCSATPPYKSNCSMCMELICTNLCFRIDIQLGPQVSFKYLVNFKEPRVHKLTIFLNCLVWLVPWVVNLEEGGWGWGGVVTVLHAA